MRTKDTILLEQAYESVYITESLILSMLEEANINPTTLQPNPPFGGAMGNRQFQVMSGNSNSAVSPQSTIQKMTQLGNAIVQKLQVSGGKKSISLVAALSMALGAISANPQIGSHLAKNEKEINEIAAEILNTQGANQQRQEVRDLSRQSENEFENNLATLQTSDPNDPATVKADMDDVDKSIKDGENAQEIEQKAFSKLSSNIGK